MKFLRSTRVMSIFLAAAVSCGTTALAAGTVTEADLPGKVMNESDAPVVVSSDITGPAMGLGSVEVLGVYVRENPTKDSEILTMAGQNDSVLVLSKEGDWYRVSCNGVTGFVSKEYMTVADSGDADLGYGLVLAGANIRTEPNEESETLESVGGKIAWILYQNDDSENIKDLLGNYPVPDILVALDNAGMEAAGEYAASLDKKIIVIGTGSSMKAIYYLDSGIAQSLVVPEDYMMGYQSVTDLAEFIHRNRFLPLARTIAHRVIHRDTLFAEENQEILFPVQR